jgi:hypothetical protein
VTARLGLLVVGVAVVLLAATCVAPREQVAGGSTWNTWTAEAKTRAVATASVVPTTATAAVVAPAETVTPGIAATGLPTATLAPFGVLVLTPGPAFCGRLCVAGLPESECWDVCLDTSYRMAKVDSGN